MIRLMWFLTVSRFDSTGESATMRAATSNTFAAWPRSIAQP